MNESNKASPSTLILMVAGIAVCIAFIIHGIHGLSADQPTSLPVTAATTRPDTAAASTTSPAPGATSPTPGPAFMAPQDGGSAISEADLAPGADPFTPIGGWKAAPEAGAAPHAASGPPNAAMPAKIQPATSTGLSGFSIQEPELVGTLLGDKPSAVFRIDQRILTIAQGGQIIGWKVVSIHQGEAVLKGMGRTIRLTTGKSGVVASSGKPSASLDTDSASRFEAVGISSTVSRTVPEINRSGHIEVTEVQVPGTQPDQSTLPQRTDNYRVTPDESGDSKSVAVSGPFVHPAPQLSGAGASVPIRNSRGSEPPLQANEPFPDPIQAPVERQIVVSGSEASYDANPNQTVGPGPKPRHHRRHRRRRAYTRRRFATARHHRYHHFTHAAIQ